MSSNVVTYIVEIDVPNQDKILLPYLTTNVQFITHDYKNVLLIPNAALRYNPEPILISEQGQEKLKSIHNEIATLKEKDPKSTNDLGIIWEETDNKVFPYLVQTKKSNGMLTPIQGEGIKEGMNIVTKSTIVNGDDQAMAAESGSVNPLMPTPPKRKKSNNQAPPHR